ncbi:MAG: RidA family protein [Candidatus Lokiarchaeota archaeon]|nr:RidA family protein [Candidatus Harpocratesius repetitus]
MSKKEVINGRAPFSDAVKIGNAVYISGQIPKNPKTGAWDSTIEGQTTQCLENIKKILEKAGGNVSDIVKITVFLTDIRNYAKMNSAYIDFFKKNGIEKELPARSAVQVGKLMYEEWNIEIDAVAILE